MALGGDQQKAPRRLRFHHDAQSPGLRLFLRPPLYNGFTVEVADTKLRAPILRNEEVVAPAVENWDNITADYTAEALNWIESHQAEPFFLHLAHNRPQIPLGASADFKGKSAYGPCGDAIEEIDWSTGQDPRKAQGPRPRRKHLRHLHLR